jgi:hypothetical protein
MDAEPRPAMGALLRTSVMMTSHLLAVPTIARTESWLWRLLVAAYVSLELTTMTLKKKSGFDNMDFLRPYEEVLKFARRLCAALLYVVLFYHWYQRGLSLADLGVANFGFLLGELLLRSSGISDWARMAGVVVGNVCRYHLVFRYLVLLHEPKMG